jgi:hypothetical protein
MPTGDKLASWDQYEIMQGQVKFLMEEGHSEEEAEQMAASDCDLFQIEYDDLKDCLTELMKERELQGPVYIEMSGFGWRSLDGHQFADVETGEQLLRAILPNTDCTFHIYDYTSGEVKGLAVNNFHHDSPVGREWYYILPAVMSSYGSEHPSWHWRMPRCMRP